MLAFDFYISYVGFFFSFLSFEETGVLAFIIVAYLEVLAYVHK